MPYIWRACLIMVGYIEDQTPWGPGNSGADYKLDLTIIRADLLSTLK